MTNEPQKTIDGGHAEQELAHRLGVERLDVGRVQTVISGQQDDWDAR